MWQNRRTTTWQFAVRTAALNNTLGQPIYEEKVSGR